MPCREKLENVAHFEENPQLANLEHGVCAQCSANLDGFRDDNNNNGHDDFARDGKFG